MQTSKQARKPRRILFVCEAVALAHVSRAIVLANALDPAEFETHLAFDGRYSWIAPEARAAAFHELSSITPGHFRDAADRTGSHIHTLEDAQRYVNDELRIYESVQPDLVVSDLRYSASTSAAVYGVRSAVIVNAHWSPYRLLEFPDSPPRPVAVVPPSSNRSLVARARRRLDRCFHRTDRSEGDLADLVDVAAFNAVRHEHGLVPFKDYEHLMTGADYVFYADPPGLIKMKPLPPEHQFIGAVTWSPSVDLHLGSIGGDRPLVYVTLGSTGETSRLQALITELAEFDADVVVATANRVEISTRASNVLVSDLVPGDEICQRASVVVGSGGSGTAYQALRHGTPFVGLWSNHDQYLTSLILQESGAALALGPGTPVEEIAVSVNKVLTDPSFSRASQYLARYLFTIEAPEVFRTALRRLFEFA